MKKGLPKYKYEKISTEAISNALRLHFDSILLFKNKSYPSAFHLSVLALEEIAKSNWIDHYVDVCETNDGFPEKEEQLKYLKLLYVHTSKQFAFINQEFHELSPKFYDYVASKKLEYKKQKSIYVGLERTDGKVDIISRISTPDQIKESDTKKIISLNNSVLISLCKRNIDNEHYYGPLRKYFIMNQNILFFLESEWKHKSGVRGKQWNYSRRKKSNA
ncbi:MAG: AbiV family abortive infection protein [Bacteroidetes bacterium]|nr:AbiV family abortive infection protein [Bacteroidota bacterium]